MGSGTNVGNSQQQKSTLYLDFVGANNQRRYQLEGHFKPNLSPRISPGGKQAAGQTLLNSYLLPYWYITCASLFIMF
jgi:hypothetical protein